MALTATIYNFETELADIDRGVYQTLNLRVARQPSETLEYMLTRFLAYCLEYTEGIEFTEGVAAGNEPAVLVRDLTGRVTAWVEVGMPDAPRLHRGSKGADRVAVYTHRNIQKVLAELTGKKIHRAEAIPVYEFGSGFVEQVAEVLQRRERVTLSINEREMYLDVSGQAFSTVVVEHRFS
ncbi:MAG: YaeQ family protein [Acidobacteria bacterium]|nr:YaeQ family protein [Acidobacteriota bacterium]